MTAATFVPVPTDTREEWLKARRQGIGGSDVAPILGLGKHGRTALSVWLEKTSDVDDTVGEAGEWGNRIEPLLAAKWAELHPTYWISPESPGLLQNPDDPWMLATPDRLVIPHASIDTDPLHVWEGKTASHWLAGEWADLGMPDAYQLQVQWYLEVLDANVAHVSVLIGGQRYEERYLPRERELGAMLRHELGQWWQKHVVDGVMPDADPKHDGPLLNALWRHLDTDPIELDHLADVVDDLRAVRRTIADLEAQEQHLIATLKAAMGEHTDAVVNGELVATWRRGKPPRKFDAAALKAEHPDLHAQYVREGTAPRTFLLKDRNTASE